MKFVLVRRHGIMAYFDDRYTKKPSEEKEAVFPVAAQSIPADPFMDGFERPYDIPVKKEVKATVSGIYITGVKGLRKPLDKPEGKKSWRAKMKEKYNSLSAELKEEKNANDKKSKKK